MKIHSLMNIIQEILGSVKIKLSIQFLKHYQIPLYFLITKKLTKKKMKKIKQYN